MHYSAEQPLQKSKKGLGPKALYRRALAGVIVQENEASLKDLSEAHELSAPTDLAIKKELERVRLSIDNQRKKERAAFRKKCLAQLSKIITAILDSPIFSTSPDSNHQQPELIRSIAHFLVVFKELTDTKNSKNQIQRLIDALVVNKQQPQLKLPSLPSNLKHYLHLVHLRSSSKS
ncbi:hypothetical protein Pst134EA_031709 [Puccinia striiformis f. sp. tritici]|uniref:uncharacterized protein n=1 Tax=Puccinia striiformis f. sp. tritici TaxID=168172 RepID=UPI002008B209|nr:uncharacterized protein Pst134EA_031709 [Puccinia striiformis f. sp. tritici]KAH9442646.1 hypothetical protein Pst134EA_031709 [Puccinia striiformis f. sp. tritici]